jgi:hypothetical protein
LIDKARIKLKISKAGACRSVLRQHTTPLAAPEIALHPQIDSMSSYPSVLMPHREK